MSIEYYSKMIIVLSGELSVEDGISVSTDLKYFHSIVDNMKDAYKIKNSLIENMNPITKQLIDKNVGLTHRNKWVVFYDTELQKVVYHIKTNGHDDGYQYTVYNENKDGETWYYTPGFGLSN